jgi:hypothetical protein
MADTQFDRNDPEFKQWLLEVIREDGATVTFTKKDGTPRKMNCTLVPTDIPEDKKPKTEGVEYSDEAVRVFDTDKQDWRSFRWDSLTRVEFKIENGVGFGSVV